MKKLSLTFVVALFTFAVPTLSFGQTHALTRVAKVAATPVVHPKLFSKATLGSVMFMVENGVDVIHAGLHVADLGLTAASANGKIPVIDEAQAVVAVADKDSGKLDGWLERQEQYLFGSSN